MVQESEIKRWVSRIVERFQPEQVILFGSYAQQQQRPDSDVDLLVVMPTIDGPSYKIAAKIRMAIKNLVSEVVNIPLKCSTRS